MLVAAPGDNRIARISDGSIRTVAKDGEAISLAVLPDGDFLFGSYIGYRITRVAPDGSTSLAAGTGEFGLSPDGSQQPGSPIMYSRGGIVSTGGGGYVYSEYAGDYRAIRRVAPDGTVTTLAGGFGTETSGDGGPATEATFAYINDIAVDADGNILVATDGLVRKIVPGGQITTVAGTGETLYDDDDVPALEANLAPTSVSPTPDGGFLLTSEGRVRKVGPDGIIHTVAGIPAPGSCDKPRYNGIQGDSGPNDLEGGRRHDLIRGEQGEDTLTGEAGHDCLLSGLGDDVVSGGDDADRVYADNGNDEISGGDGNDSLVGEGGNDMLRGEDGADSLFSGFGDDRLVGGAGRDVLYGDTGEDVFIGGRGRDEIDAFTNERESYDGPPDVIRCGRGRDTVKANSYDRVTRSCEVVKGPAGED